MGNISTLNVADPNLNHAPECLKFHPLLFANDGIACVCVCVCVSFISEAVWMWPQGVSDTQQNKWAAEQLAAHSSSIQELELIVWQHVVNF